MKKMILTSVLLAGFLIGCGSNGNCCDASAVKAPELGTTTPDLNVTGEVTPPTPTPTPQTVAPTAIISLTDSAGPLVVHTNHTFSCADSHDNDTLGTGKEIASCEWSIQSYKADANGNLIPYRNCTDEVMNDKPIYICDKVVKIVATLKVTDNDGQTDTTTTEYLDFSQQ